MNDTRFASIGPFEIAAVALAVGAAVHIVAWLAGPWWVEALGAPPAIVASAAEGSWPALLGTSIIAATLLGLAICCIMSSHGVGPQSLQRGILMVAAAIFVVRGLLVVPYAFAGQRDWHTPIGWFVVNGQWFIAGSMAVLVIGMLISIGLFQTTSKRLSITRSSGM